jgi:hypothetical protein
MAVLVILRDRYTIYTNGIENMNNRLISASNGIALSLGVEGNFLITAVLSQAIRALYFIQIFLNEVSLDGTWMHAC